MRKIAQDADLLFDYALAHPDGFTYHDVQRDLHWRTSYFRNVVRVARLALAEHKASLVCNPSRVTSAPWIYRLLGMSEEAHAWQAHRVRHLEARLMTDIAVAQALVNSTNGRTIDGRKARKILSTFTYLRGELADIDANGHIS